MRLSFVASLFLRWWQRLSQSGWLLTDRLVRMGVGFFVGVVMARLLGPANYGTFAYATALASLFLPVLSLGLERVVIRDLARYPEKRAVLLGTTVVLRLVGGVLSFVLAVGGTLWIHRESSSTCLLVAVIAAGNVFMAADVVDWAFQADGRFRLPVLVRISCFVVGCAVRIGLAASGASLTAIASATFGELIVVGFLLMFFAQQVGGASLQQWRLQRSMAFQLLSVSWPLLVAEVCNWVVQRLDLLILKSYVIEQEVGYYAVAQRVAQAGFFLPVVVVQVLSPKFARATDARAVLELTGRAMNVLSTAGLGISLLLCVCTPWLLPLLFGRLYAPAVPLILILAWSNVFVFIGCCHALYMINTDQQYIALRMTWVTAMCSIILDCLLIPRWHALGAATASFAATAFTAIVGVAFFPESRPLFNANLRALWAPFRLLSPSWWRGSR